VEKKENAIKCPLINAKKDCVRIDIKRKADKGFALVAEPFFYMGL